MAEDVWKPSEFPTANTSGVVVKAGYVYRGLGLYMAQAASPKGRRPPLWCLVHLGSGHAVFCIKGNVAKAFPIASEVAECSDWASFDGLDGWENTDPELKEKFWALYWKYEGKTALLGTAGAMHERAREVAMARDN